MTTLTTTPSPAASPHSLFITHLGLSQRPTRSPRLTPYQSSPSSRPLSHTTATSHSPRLTTGTIASTIAPPHSPHSSTITATQPATQPPTADAATQYTPDGLPPTAGTKRKDPDTNSPMTALPTGDIPLSTEPTKDQPPVPAQHGQATPASLGTPPESLPEEDPSISKPKRLRTAENLKIMPSLYEDCNPKDLGFLISNMLLELIRLNDQIPLNGRLTRFHSRAPPGISCHDYLQRLIQHATLSPPILLSMVYYIDRLCAMYPAFNVSSLTVHRFLITAATVASKGLSDSFWTNPTYARIGGITTGELATLEMEFLQKVQWRIVPKPEVLVDYYVSLIQRSDGYELEHNLHLYDLPEDSADATPDPPIVGQDHIMETDPP